MPIECPSDWKSARRALEEYNRFSDNDLTNGCIFIGAGDFRFNLASRQLLFLLAGHQLEAYMVAPNQLRPEDDFLEQLHSRGAKFVNQYYEIKELPLPSQIKPVLVCQSAFDPSDNNLIPAIQAHLSRLYKPKYQLPTTFLNLQPVVL